MFIFFNCLVIYGVVLLLGVVSLMAGATTGVPMYPWHGGYEPQRRYRPTSYYTGGPQVLFH